MNAFEPLTDCCLCHTNYLVPIPVGLVLQARPNQPQRGLLSVSCFQYHVWVGNKWLGCVILKVICTAVGWVWLARLAVAKVQKRHLKTISRDAASHSVESTRLQHHGIKFNIYVPAYIMWAISPGSVIKDGFRVIKDGFRMILHLYI